MFQQGVDFRLKWCWRMLLHEHPLSPRTCRTLRLLPPTRCCSAFDSVCSTCRKQEATDGHASVSSDTLAELTRSMCGSRKWALYLWCQGAGQS